MVAYGWWEWAFNLAVWGVMGWCVLGGPILIAVVTFWRLVHRRPLRSPTERHVTAVAWELVQADDYGTLWRPRRMTPDHLLVEVVNSTPEPDGSFRPYRIPVPPTVRTAREAVAWTFGFSSASEYTPSSET